MMSQYPNNDLTSIQLASIFQDGMVFQKGQPIRIWGEGEGELWVSFLGKKCHCIAKNNHWLVVFPPQEYGGPYSLEITAAGQEQPIVIRNIVIGEVILFAGQSNIQFHLSEGNVPDCEYLNDPDCRLFVCDRPEAGEFFSSQDGWVAARKENAGQWSALAYLVSREARRSGIPYVGAIVCTQGASVIQSWISSSSLADFNPAIKPEDLFCDHSLFPQWNSPAFLYRYSTKKICPYSIGNTVWYQGESNTSEAESKVYLKLLTCLIGDWRKSFQNDSLPFYVICLANFRTDDAWKRVQKAQMLAEKEIPYVSTVLCGDISETTDIHPATKSPLAARIFLRMRENHTI